MRVLPILFNTEMVLAIENGKKVTRRCIKPQPEAFGKAFVLSDGIYAKNAVAKNGPYRKGDILYVRETYAQIKDGYVYKANFIKDDTKDNIKWKPSIHMPKEAARIWIKVTNVRFERLNDISEEEAIAEGANLKHGKNIGVQEKMARSAIERFAEIWDSTMKESELGTYGWNANPYVWTIEFERCEKPKENRK